MNVVPQGVAGEHRRCQVESEASESPGGICIKQGEICWIFHGKHVTVVPFLGDKYIICENHGVFFFEVIEVFFFGTCVMG